MLALLEPPPAPVATGDWPVLLDATRVDEEAELPPEPDDELMVVAGLVPELHAQNCAIESPKPKNAQRSRREFIACLRARARAFAPAKRHI